MLMLLPVLLAGCAAASGAGRYPDEGDPTPIPVPPAAAKPTFTVERGDLQTEVALTGRIGPALQEALAFTLDGQVAEVPVEELAPVRAGDVVARLDTSALEAERLLAQAAFDIAQGRLAARQAEVERNRRRAELRRDIARLDLDHATAQAGPAPAAAAQYEIDRLALALQLAQLDVDELDLAIDPALQVEVDQAALRLQQIDAALAATALVAPFDGIVLDIHRAPGRTAAAGEPVVTVADISELQAGAVAREQDLQQLTEDLPATVQDASGRGETLAATVVGLPYPYGSGGAGGEDGDRSVSLAFDDPAAAAAIFALGDRVQIVTITAVREGTLWLPAEAVREFNGRRFVVVEQDGVQQRIDVKLGIEGDGRVEILEGLSEGQLVVAP